jgi:hypothetical protein
LGCHPRAENEVLAHLSQRRRVLLLHASPPSSTSPSESSQPGDGNRDSDNQRSPGKQNTPESSVSAAVAASSSAAAAAAADSPRTRASRRQRLQVAGVSVSPTGFHVVLQKNSTHYLPLRATDDSAGADREAATSPQALTLLQLLARVDMAGAILPPDVLSRIVVLSLEGGDDAERRRLREQEEGDDGSEGGGGGDRVRGEPSPSAVGSRVLALVGERLAKLEAYGGTPGKTTYGELHEYPWLQSRVLLPTVTLDGLVLSLPPQSCVSPTPAYALECSVKNLPGGGPSSLSVELSEGVCERVSYEYRPLGISRTFIALALALRYRAPIELVQPPDGGEAPGGSSSFLTLDQVRERFPLYRTSDQLRQTPERVATNIERGLKVNQLQAALRVALQREDFAAAAKIRAALDEMDSLQDLPTQEESDTGSMQ